MGSGLGDKILYRTGENSVHFCPDPELTWPPQQPLRESDPCFRGWIAEVLTWHQPSSRAASATVSETRIDTPMALSGLWWFDFLGIHLDYKNKKPERDLQSC